MLFISTDVHIYLGEVFFLFWNESKLCCSYTARSNRITTARDILYFVCSWYA